MANAEQLSILKQGVQVWNTWRENNPKVEIDLEKAPLAYSDLSNVNLKDANLYEADFSEADLHGASLSGADLRDVEFSKANLRGTDLSSASLDLAGLVETDLRWARFAGSRFWKTAIGYTLFGYSDLSDAIDLDEVQHYEPSIITMDVLALSKGKIPETFLKGCGLSDTDIEYSKLHNPDLTNDEKSKILYRIYDLQASQAIQISPLFISYSHVNSEFVDKIGNCLTEKGVRYWRDIKDMKSGRMEKQIDRAIRQNPTMLLVLSENSLNSDWIEHEVRTARVLEKEKGHDVLCPVALDDSWKSSPWPKRIMEQIMEYNILDFSAWEDDNKFDEMFHKLIDGLELFYKG